MFEEIDVEKIMINPPTEIGKKWMLLTAGTEAEGYNTMTIAWGHMGAIWEEKKHGGAFPTFICYVRPSRYTKEFVDREPYFTLCSFPEERRRALGYLGHHSGRDEDKVAKAGLTPVFADGTTYFAEAETVYICEKIYHAPLKEEGFVDRSLIDANYPNRDFHEMYIGKIVKILKKTD